ncbi:MAG: HEAT repeat domain-containing protein, partial [Deltaproteobacteria bacterium]
RMNRLLYPANVLLLGLFTAQVLATIQVHLSNTDLYHNLMAIKEAGYLTIPNQRIMHSLQEFGPALSGGIFFTFSVGTGLTIFSLAAVWVWDRLLHRNKIFLIPFLILWIGSLLVVNHRGFCPMVTSYFLFIPPLVFVATLRWMPPASRQRVWLNRMIYFIPVLLLALLWTSQMDSHLFLDLRDHLLLSNPSGTKIVDFYYDYTLYPAEVFKSLDQKILKTWDLENIQKTHMVRSLESELLNHDYIHVGEDVAVDLKIAREGNILALGNKERTILRTTSEELLSSPGSVLKEFSSKSDRHAFFRKFTFFSLLIGFPISLYIILYALFHFVSCLFLGLRTSSVIASILCFLIGITLLVHFHHSRERGIEVKDLAGALESEDWQNRVAALKIIQQKGMEVGGFQAYRGMLASPHIPERYWLVRALGVSRQSETFEDLLSFLDDPHPNVVSMAFYALGQRGERRAVKEIIKRVEISDNWYNQWYAYKALRNLGWKQTRSK